MRNHGQLCLSFITALASMQVHALAVEECNRVVSDPAIFSEQVRTNAAVQLVLQSRFARTDFVDASTHLSLGLGKPLAESVLGRKINEAEFLERRIYFRNLVTPYAVQPRFEIDALLAAKIPQVTALWKDCVRMATGVSIRFEPQSPRDTIVYFELHGAPGNATTITSDVELPEFATIVSGRRCFTKGEVIRVGEPCLAVISLNSALKPLLLALQTTGSLTLGQLPARLRQTSQQSRYQFTPNCDLTSSSSEAERVRCSDRLWAKTTGRDRRVSTSVEMQPDLMRLGWEFDDSVAKSEFIILDRVSPSNTTHCKDFYWANEPSLLKYGYFMKSGREHGQPATITCMLKLEMGMKRTTWDAAL
jgi:hypothetical protein